MSLWAGTTLVFHDHGTLGAVTADTAGAVTHKDTEIISDKQMQLFMIINHNIINSSIALCGLVTNVINIIVFCKQGFDNTMNISFFGLAVSDLCSLLTMLWFSLCLNPLFASANIVFLSMEIQHLTAGMPHICFVRVTGWITVFVTAERCLCITFPLKIKRIITPRVTTAIICFIYVSIFLSFVPEYQTSYIDWRFYPARNRSVLGLAFTSDRKNMEGLAFFLYSILGSVSFVAVILFTVVLVVQLKQKSKWRSQAHVDKLRSESICNRDRKTMNMVVMIAVVLIVCYTPGVIISMSSFFWPEFNFLGSQLNIFFTVWSFAFTFQALNSSVNIVLYYNMSSKYRATFTQVFALDKKALKSTEKIPITHSF